MPRHPKSCSEFSTGFIDDTAFVVIGPSIEANIAQLDRLCESAMGWSSTYACQFDYEARPLTINGMTIQPSETAKYLGIIIDCRLRWKQQVEAAIVKGTSTILAISRLARPTYGMATQLHATAVHSSVREEEVEGFCGDREATGKGAEISRPADNGCVPNNGHRCTGIPLVPPTLRTRLNSTAYNNAVRFATLPLSHPLHLPVARCMRAYIQRHRSPLHELYDAFPELWDVECIDPTPRPATCYRGTRSLQ
ncbi:hypothetical protein B0H14DRAFT_3435936 [Mycena olivaceomarginata]|nr:hypothetical protein B0H14DRAFT_3435936 [Mycena olivaceomarginata]